MLTLKRTARSRNPELLGQTVAVIAGSAGIGLEIARHARTAGADVVLTGSDPAQLAHAALEAGAEGTAAFDPRDQVAVKAFFDAMPGSIDHVVLTAIDVMASKTLAGAIHDIDGRRRLLARAV